jgi:hypothetical protein
MSCEHLICAQCAGPVVEGRCPACRASRDHVHHPHFSASPQLIVAAILALAFLLLLAVHFGVLAVLARGDNPPTPAARFAVAL